MSGLSGNSYKLYTPSDINKAKQNELPDDADFTYFGGFKTNQNANTLNSIDITNKDHGEDKTFLAHAGIKESKISGDGIFQNSPLTRQIEGSFEDKDARWFRLIRPDGRVTSLKCMIQSYNVTGATGDAIQFSLELLSTGGKIIKDANGLVRDTNLGRVTTFPALLENYSYSSINSPVYSNLNDVPDDLPTALGTFLDTATLQVMQGDEDPVVLSGEAGGFVVPILLLKMSELTGKTLQFLDALDFVLPSSRIKEIDIGGESYRAFYFLDVVLANNESRSVKIQIG